MRILIFLFGWFLLIHGFSVSGPVFAAFKSDDIMGVTDYCTIVVGLLLMVVSFVWDWVTVGWY